MIFTPSTCNVVVVLPPILDCPASFLKIFSDIGVPALAYCCVADSGPRLNWPGYRIPLVGRLPGGGINGPTRTGSALGAGSNGFPGSISHLNGVAPVVEDRNGVPLGLVFVLVLLLALLTCRLKNISVSSSRMCTPIRLARRFRLMILADGPSSSLLAEDVSRATWWTMPPAGPGWWSREDVTVGSRADDIGEFVAVVSTDSKIASPGPLGRPGCSSHVKGTTPGVPTMSEESENSDDSESRAGSDPVTIILAKVRNPLQTLEQTSEELFSGDEDSSALNLQPSVTNLSFGNFMGAGDQLPAARRGSSWGSYLAWCSYAP